MGLWFFSPSLKIFTTSAASDLSFFYKSDSCDLAVPNNWFLWALTSDCIQLFVLRGRPGNSYWKGKKDHYWTPPHMVINSLAVPNNWFLWALTSDCIQLFCAKGPTGELLLKRKERSLPHTSFRQLNLNKWWLHLRVSLHKWLHNAILQSIRFPCTLTICNVSVGQIFKFVESIGAIFPARGYQ